MAAFAELLKQAREKAGLSQYSLALQAGITPQALSLLELGEREPSWQTVQRLILVLGVSCDYFLDRDLQVPGPGAAPRPAPGRPPKKT